MQSNSSNNIDDKELLKNFYKDNDNNWLGKLLPKYTLLLLGVCMKYLKNEEDAKDAVQQIFLKIIVELHKYKVEYFKSWIYMIAKNHCLMKLRDKVHSNIEIDERITDAHWEPDEYNIHTQKECSLNELSDALLTLNSEQQQCLTLFYLNKFSYNEISKNTGFTLMQVKSHIQNGKRNLRSVLKTKNEI